MSEIRLRRAYDRGVEPGDGRRVLVDRVWPRGLTREELALDSWLRDVAPSTELRTWFGHRPERWEEFQRRYREELARAPRRELVDELVAAARREPVTLLFGARDQRHNQAVVIRDVVEERLSADR
jgi:uncharacterized protein YeaO (DUF488 family)